MGYWIKNFTDGSSESGSDLDISLSVASWTRGRQKDILSVALSDNSTNIKLTLPNTEWFQFDRYEVLLGEEGKQYPNRTARVIQAKLTHEHLAKFVSVSIKNKLKHIELVDTPNDCIVLDEYLNQWFTVTIQDDDTIISINPTKGSLLNGKVLR